MAACAWGKVERAKGNIAESGTRNFAIIAFSVAAQFGVDWMIRMTAHKTGGLYETSYGQYVEVL